MKYGNRSCTANAAPSIGRVLVSYLLIFSLTWNSVGFAEETFLQRMRASAGRGLNYVRLVVVNDEQVAKLKGLYGDYVSPAITAVRRVAVANDEQWAQLKIARGEAEHALEPPMEEERFWYRKLELLKDPRAAADFRRSFENITRVVYLSKYFESPWLRRLIVLSATMFGMTHGSEAVTGVSMGFYFLFWAVVALFSGDFATAGLYGGISLGWFGMALPGLYDFACYMGAGVLFFRPTRAAFDVAHQVVFWVGGKTAKAVGIPALLAAILEKKSAREKLEKAFASKDLATAVEFEFTDEELLNVVQRDGAGKELYRMRFTPHEGDNVELAEAQVQLDTFTSTEYEHLLPALSSYGWNVKGVMRQIHKLARKGKIDLLQYEHTFVESVDITDNVLKVKFREHSVRVMAERSLKPGYRYLNPVNTVKDCAKAMRTWGAAKRLAAEAAEAGDQDVVPRVGG